MHVHKIFTVAVVLLVVVLTTAVPGPGTAGEVDDYVKISSLACTDDLKGKLSSSQLQNLKKITRGESDSFFNDIYVSGQKGVNFTENVSIIVAASFLCNHFSLRDDKFISVYQSPSRKNGKKEFHVTPPE